MQKEPGPIGPIMDAIKEKLNPWLGEPKRKQSEGRVALIWRVESEEGLPLRLKVEINSREHFTVLGYQQSHFSMPSRWYSGSASITSYSKNELLGTKLRALYQRKKGRDLFDLWHAAGTIESVVSCFLQYLEHEQHRISRAGFEINLFEKLDDPRFLDDMAPLLTSTTSWDAWQKTQEKLMLLKTM